MDSNNLILSITLIIFSIFFYKYFLIVLKKYNSKVFFDNEFKKPQAFHVSATPVIGGICIYFSLLFVYFNFLFFKNITFLDYIFFCTPFFFTWFF